MTIFVDEIRTYPEGKFCHMWTDDDDAELDNFAFSIGLKKSYSHTSNGLSGRFYHYDLTINKRQLALSNGAKFMRLKDWIRSKLNSIE